MATHDDLAAQVDAAFTERLNEAAATAYALMNTFSLAADAYQRDELDDAENIVYRAITDSDTPTRTAMHLCAAGAGVIASLIDDAPADCDVHGPNCRCDRVVEFNLNMAGDPLARSALKLCNAAARYDPEEVSTVVNDTYNTGGFAQIRRMLLALVQLHHIVRRGIEETGA